MEVDSISPHCPTGATPGSWCKIQTLIQEICRRTPQWTSLPSPCPVGGWETACGELTDGLTVFENCAFQSVEIANKPRSVKQFKIQNIKSTKINWDKVNVAIMRVLRLQSRRIINFKKAFSPTWVHQHRCRKDTDLRVTKIDRFQDGVGWTSNLPFTESLCVMPCSFCVLAVPSIILLYWWTPVCLWWEPAARLGSMDDKIQWVINRLRTTS